MRRDRKPLSPTPRAAVPPPPRRDAPPIAFSIEIYLPGEPRPWDIHNADERLSDEHVPFADTGTDSLAAWTERMRLVCHACGLRNIDFLGTCRTCGASKRKVT